MQIKLKKDAKAGLALLIFLGFTAWWALLHFGHQPNTNHILDWFAGTYGVLALLGGIWGLSISSKWGGYKSVLGRAILMLSLGLLAQEFGQLAYAYYAIVKHIEVPYPSIGDIGFFGSVLFYIYATYLLAHASGAKMSLKSLGNKLIVLVVPAAILLTSYHLFLKGYEFDWSQPVATILDFGYPFGQAIYISTAILAYFLSRKLLGGIMRPKILLLLFALCTQYAADFNFLYQSSHGTWTTATYGDYLYAFSYLIMTLAILNLGRAYAQIRSQTNG